VSAKRLMMTGALKTVELQELTAGNMGKRITTKIDVRMPDVPEEVDIYDFGDEDADQSGSQSGQEYDFDFGDEDSKTGTPPPAHTDNEQSAVHIADRSQQ
jgi:hypothetical protein